jgi:chromosome segregation ATPase
MMQELRDKVDLSKSRARQIEGQVQTITHEIQELQNRTVQLQDAIRTKTARKQELLSKSASIREATSKAEADIDKQKELKAQLGLIKDANANKLEQENDRHAKQMTDMDTSLQDEGFAAASLKDKQATLSTTMSSTRAKYHDTWLSIMQIQKQNNIEVSSPPESTSTPPKMDLAKLTDAMEQSLSAVHNEASAKESLHALTASLRQEIDAIQHSAEQQETELKQIEEHVFADTEASRTREAELKQKMDQHTAIKTTVTDLHTAVKKNRSERDEAVDKLKGDRSRLEKEVNELLVLIEDAKKRLSVEQSSHEAAKHDQASKEEHLKAKVIELSNQLAATGAEIEMIEKEASDAMTAVDDIQLYLTELTATHEPLCNIEENIAKLLEGMYLHVKKISAHICVYCRLSNHHAPQSSLY